MTRVDNLVLEFLDDKNIAAPPKVIYDNTHVKADVSHTQIKRRCLRLNETGLVFKDQERGDGYAISELGRSYLKGAVSLDLLEALDRYAENGRDFSDAQDLTVEDVESELRAAGLLDVSE